MLDRIIEPSVASMPESATVRVSRSQWITALRMKSWLAEYRRGAEPIQLGELALPRRVGATSTGAIRVLCLAPGEWLLLANESAAELREQLQPSLHTQGLTFTDWSDAFATFVVEGSMARTLLAKGCGLDLHPQSFPEGPCARTRFAQLPVILQCTSASSFELAAARSYSSYLHEWLIDAAAEWEETKLV
jgi:heterotetrameric sarcosine oxidase gamma subunit